MHSRNVCILIGTKVEKDRIIVLSIPVKKRIPLGNISLDWCNVA